MKSSYSGKIAFSLFHPSPDLQYFPSLIPVRQSAFLLLQPFPIIRRSPLVLSSRVHFFCCSLSRFFSAAPGVIVQSAFLLLQPFPIIRRSPPVFSVKVYFCFYRNPQSPRKGSGSCLSVHNLPCKAAYHRATAYTSALQLRRAV